MALIAVTSDLGRVTTNFGYKSFCSSIAVTSDLGRVTTKPAMPSSRRASKLIEADCTIAVTSDLGRVTTFFSCSTSGFI